MFTFCTISFIIGLYSESCDFSKPSANKLGATDPILAVPPYLMAFSRAYALITSLFISVMVCGGDWGL